MAAAAAQVQKNSKSVRKPKLAPTKVHNLHHINYLNEKAREKELAENPPTGLSIDRPVSHHPSLQITNIPTLLGYYTRNLYLSLRCKVWGGGRGD